MLDIYSASEKPIRGIHSRAISETIKQEGHKNVIYLQSHDHVNDLIMDKIEDFDILVTQGAGSVSKVCESIKNKWTKSKIAVLYGGLSSEREISLKSGLGVHKAICDLGYESDLIDFKNLNNLHELKIYDFVFIALHGFEGEGGKLQEDLDDLNILYSGSNSVACKNTWNKRLAKEILKKNNIRTPVLEVKFTKTIVNTFLCVTL